ncbi:MAG TPA: hypothetical protein VE242_02605 [Chthoniobacterales bacterium]|nr:hypothetical protein [Chthoniobacterales bacterium]
MVADKGEIDLFNCGYLGRAELFNAPPTRGSQNDFPPVNRYLAKP